MIVRRTSCVVLLLALARPAAAQVDPSGSWRTLHTQHFRIHFRPAYRVSAVVAAREAERAYALLSTELHRPRGIIDVTLSDDFDTPNGFTTTYPSNRFTILLVPPVSEPALQTFDSCERLVIVHELTHVFHLDRSRGIWKTLQTVFGRVPALFPNQYQPSWVIEGLATYYESRFTAGGRAAGSYHRQAVAADAAAGHARSPWDALYFTRWPDGLAPYAYGSRFWEYLSQTDPSGDSVPRRAALARRRREDIRRAALTSHHGAGELRLDGRHVDHRPARLHGSLDGAERSVALVPRRRVAAADDECAAQRAACRRRNRVGAGAGEREQCPQAAAHTAHRFVGDLGAGGAVTRRALGGRHPSSERPLGVGAVARSSSHRGHRAR